MSSPTAPPALTAVRHVSTRPPSRRVARVRASRRGLSDPVGLLSGSLALLVIVVSFGSARADAGGLALEVRLADSGRTIAELVAVVEAAAAAADVVRPYDELTVVLTDRIPGVDVDPLVGGLSVGDTVWVRTEGVAMPSRTLLHEVAHAFTPGAGHGEPFRRIYLAAVHEVYGSEVASRELRRLAWVYDRCYLDRSCPRSERALPDP